MANLYTKIKKYLEENNKTVSEFDNNIKLEDDWIAGVSNPHIKEWNLDIPEPTDEQLNSYESSAQTEENNHVVRTARKSAYGDIGDQLDEIYKDIDAWKARIKSIKDANPKE